ncbi:SH3 domain-containing protein [Lutibaculum baratangense]
MSSRVTRLILAALVAAVLALPAVPAAAQDGMRTGPSGLPLPRFVSLKSDRINLRGGPGQDYQVEWIYNREGLPVEIVAEYDNWRRIRDSEGDEGWVFHSLLSGRRTALITPWIRDKETRAELHRSASNTAKPTAILEPNVLVDVRECDGSWCRVRVQDVEGWIEQERLWGVYPGETIRP